MNHLKRPDTKLCDVVESAPLHPNEATQGEHNQNDFSVSLQLCQARECAPYLAAFDRRI